MPTVDVDPDELRRFVGEQRDDETLKEDLFSLGLEFEGTTEDGELRLEFEPDRLDRLSVEGIARSLRYQYGTDRGVYLPDTNDPEWTVRVEDVPAERPYVTAAVARGLELDEAALESIIQLQEKLHATIGRGRAKGAIGVHDLTFLQGAALDEDAEKAVRYTGIDPEGDSFVPLDSDAEMTPADVLAEHPIGDDYADLVAEYGSMPAIYDEVGLFSFPPVINGRRTEVSTDSRDLFVEMTGTDQWTVDRMLNIVCYALDARGATLESVRVEYPDRAVYDDPAVDRVEPGAELVRPDLSTKTKTVSHDRVESLLGVEFGAGEVVDRLERSGLDADVIETAGGDDADGELAYRVTVPPYRVDVLHPLDVVDDVGRAHGFNELEPRYPDVSTVGGRHERSRLERAVRERLVGQGFEDTLNFHLVGGAANYDRMRLDRPDGPGAETLGAGAAATVKNPYSEEYELVRTWALPSLALLLENNTHRAYPQRVSEVGFAATRDESEPTGLDERTTVAAAVAATDAGYDDAKGHLQALAGAFDADLSTPPTDHPSFIDGRTAEVVLDGEPAGVVGELHPEVLVDHDLAVPVAAFEFRLDALR